MLKKRSIAVGIDPRSTFARQIIEGVARFSVERSDWSLPLTSGVPYVSPGSIDKWNGDGVIVGMTSEWAERLKGSRIPFVNVSSQFQVAPVPSVITDNEAVGRLACEHLLAKGLRKFIVATYESHDRLLDHRATAFRQAVEEAGADCIPVLVRRVLHNGEVVKDDTTELRKYLRKIEGPIGLFAMDDLMARAVVQACESLGRRVPEDVAVVGEGNWPVVCDIMTPQLTSIDLGADRIGYRAAQLLQSIFEGGPVPNEPILVPPRRIMQRRSTEMLAIEDQEVRTALRFIRENCRMPIQVADVEQAATVNRRTLERRFARDVGRTIGREIRRARIGVACQLLSDTDLAVHEISPACGFVNRQCFNAAFHAEMGVTPSTYRRTRRR